MNWILLSTWLFTYGLSFAQETSNKFISKIPKIDNHRIINGQSIDQDCEVLNGKWVCKEIEIKKNDFFFNMSGDLIKNQKD